MAEVAAKGELVQVPRHHVLCQAKGWNRSRVPYVWRTGQPNLRIVIANGRTTSVRRHKAKGPDCVSPPISLRTLTYLITKELKRSNSLYGVMLENQQLKTENEKLKRKLKCRNKQVKTLSQDMLKHQEVMKQHKETLYTQRSQTESIQQRLQGLSLAVQGLETEQQRADKLNRKKWI